MLQDRLNLITQLSVFLPPPLSHLVSPPDLSSARADSPLILDDQLRLVPGLRFWNTHGGFAHGLGVGGDDGRWWSVEDLGSGASVVRSKHDEDEKEVWVLRVGEGESGQSVHLRKQVWLIGRGQDAAACADALAPLA